MSDADLRSEQHRRRAADLALVMPSNHFFRGLTAAVLMGLPVPARLLRDSKNIEVGVLHPDRNSRRVGVRSRQFRPGLVRVTAHEGLRTLDPSTLWATLGPRLDFADRVALGDSIVRTPRVGGQRPDHALPALASIAELAEAARTPGRYSRGALLEALPHLRDGIASAPESHLRLAIVAAGFEEPELDVDVYSEGGLYLGTSELAYSKYRLALEYEGDHHRTDRRQWYRDLEKVQAYRDAGWETLRVSARALYSQRPKLMESLRLALMRCGWRA